jgi:transposase
MSQEIKPDYDQTFVLPPVLDDWIPSDHPARFVREFVESIDLDSIGFKGRKSHEGRPRYSNELLLKVWLLGHFNDIRSTRKLERACREMIGMLWLTGLISPDHNTLWRFLQRNQEAISKVMVQSVHLARSFGLLGMNVHAVDGTKVQGRGSTESVVRRRKLEKELERIEKEVSEYLEDVAEVEDQEEGEYRLPEELADKEKRKKWIEDKLAELDEAGTNAEHVTDPESREMKTRGKTFFGFNAQAVVDLDSGIVVAEDVTNEQNDMHQLAPMLLAVNENLEATADETLADGGYATLEQLGEVHEKGFNVIVDLPSKFRPGTGEPPFCAADFTYDPESEEVLCLLGKSLRFCGTKNERWGRFRVRVYRCQFSKTCSLKSQCSAARRGHGIVISPYHEALQEQREKLERDEVRETLKRRPAVETTFANAKEVLGLRRFTAWGLNGAKTQWSLLCTTINLKKTFHHWVNRGNQANPNPQVA